MNAAPVVIVTGPPGAGKSTVAALLVRRWSPSALVAGDTFFGFLREGRLNPWLPTSHAQNETVVDAAAAATGRLARGGITVVYDGVIGPWFLPAFHAASGVGTVHYALLLPPEEVCLERVRTRTGHGFTALDAARHLHADFARAAIDPRHVVRPAPADDAAEVSAAVAASVAAGALAVT